MSRQTDPESQPLLGSDPSASAASAATPNDKQPPAKRRTPLPKVQLTIACFVRVTEPIAFMSCFPYINQMLLDVGVVDDPKKTGFYAGLIESIFAVAELCTVFQWGAASDRWGRKPVLLIGCAGAAISSILFGFSQTFPMMILTRVINGLANGNVAVLKSVIGELCDETNQGVAFSFFPLAMAIGTILASSIGGYFPRITDRYPALGAAFPVLERYPYLLPCLVAGVFPLLGGVVAWGWLEETLPGREGAAGGSGVAGGPGAAGGSGAAGAAGAEQGVHPHRTVHYSSTDDGDVREEGAADHHNTCSATDSAAAAAATTTSGRDTDTASKDADGPPVRFRDLLTPSINALMLSFGLLQLQGISFLGLLPLFCFTPTSAGGLSFPSSLIGLAMSIRGMSTIVVQLLAFPWLQKRVGTVRLYKALVVLFVPAFVLLPATNVLARKGREVEMWVGLSVSLVLYSIGNMAFACNLMMVNDAAPNRRSLGAINGWSQAVSSLMRAIGPASSSTLFALSVDKQMLGGQLVWVVLSVLSLVSVWMALRLKGDLGKA